jgi:predicted O-methyltransferase YrrM
MVSAILIGLMRQETWDAVDSYINELFVSPDEDLDSALEASAAAGLPPIQVSPNQGKLLYLIAKAQRATRILEIGTLGGYSTIWLARAVAPSGRVITLEIDERYAEVARANLARAGLADVAEVRVGRALEELPLLEGPFDLIFIDADKSGYPDYLVKSLDLSRPGTLIVADNVVRDGSILDASSDDPNVRGVRRFNELLAAEPRVSATAIQMVGTKGYDGFAVALVVS